MVRQEVQIGPEDRIIAVMGTTGVGKSSFINLFTDEDVGIGEDLESFTTQVAIFPCKLSGSDNETFYLVDTPGFDDSNKPDQEILRELSSWLSMTYSNSIQLSGIIYLHRIMDVRFGGTALRNLRMFKKLCGENALGSVVLATTFWGVVDESTGNDREAQLKSTQNYWKGMIDKGSTVFRHDADVRSGRKIIQYLLDRQSPRPTYAIQDEMVNQKKKLDETEAGAEVQAEMEKLRKKYEQQLKELEAEMRQAIAAKDQATREELQKERQKADDFIKAELQERKKMHAETEKLWLQREEERKREREEHAASILKLERQLTQMQADVRDGETRHDQALKIAEIQKELEISEARRQAMMDAKFSTKVGRWVNGVLKYL